MVDTDANQPATRVKRQAIKQANGLKRIILERTESG